MNTKNLVKLLEREIGPPTFGGFLRGARASKEMSQVQMAKFLGISRSTLCDIEKSRFLVSPAMAYKIAKKCGLPEKIAVRASLQDQIIKAKLKFVVDLKVA